MSNNWDDPDAPLWDEDSPLAFWDLDPQQGKKKRMTNLQIDDVLGFGALLRAAANEHKAQLIAKEYDPTAKIAATNTQATALGDAKAQAKTAEMTASVKVKAAEDLKQTHYDALSSWTDMMAGTLGKTTPEGKAILAIRANLKGSGPHTPPAPPAPPTP